MSLRPSWFEEDIAPLYNQRQELKVRSICRKLGGLRQSVEIALHGRLRGKDPVPPRKLEQMRVVEAELRQANGSLEEMKKIARRAADELEYSSSRKILRTAGASLVESWSLPGSDEEPSSEIVSNAVTHMVQVQTTDLRRRMVALTHKLHQTLESTAKVLEMENVPAEEELASVLREMPAFDLGQLTFRLSRPALLTLLGRRVSESFVTKKLTGLIGAQLRRSLSAYRALYDWSQRTLGQIQRRFDAYANGYRAQVERSLAGQDLQLDQEASIRHDLEALDSAPAENTMAS